MDLAAKSFQNSVWMQCFQEVQLLSTLNISEILYVWFIAALYDRTRLFNTQRLVKTTAAKWVFVRTATNGWNWRRAAVEDGHWDEQETGWNWAGPEVWQVKWRHLVKCVLIFQSWDGIMKNNLTFIGKKYRISLNRCPPSIKCPHWLQKRNKAPRAIIRGNIVHAVIGLSDVLLYWPLCWMNKQRLILFSRCADIVN